MMCVDVGAAAAAEPRVTNARQSRCRQSYSYHRAASSQVPPPDNADDAAAACRAEGHVESVRQRDRRRRRRSHTEAALQHHG